MWNNLDSVGLAVVEFGLDASFSCSTTTNPQFNFILCQTVCLCVCESVKTVVAAAHLLQLVCLWFPPAGVWLVPVHHSSPSASHTPPASHKGLHQSLWKKREKGSFYCRPEPVLFSSLRVSQSHLFGLRRCLARAHLEPHSTLLPCRNHWTHSFSNNPELDLWRE